MVMAVAAEVVVVQSARTRSLHASLTARRSAVKRQANGCAPTGQARRTRLVAAVVSRVTVAAARRGRRRVAEILEYVRSEAKMSCAA